MDEKEINSLIELRNILMTSYRRLDRTANPSSAVMLQKDVAVLIESSMQKIDGLLANYVNFQSAS